MSDPTKIIPPFKTDENIEQAILPIYLRHLAGLVREAAKTAPKPKQGYCPVVTVPVDADALYEAADLLDAALEGK